jgi:hypothetical protein
MIMADEQEATLTITCGLFEPVEASSRSFTAGSIACCTSRTPGETWTKEKMGSTSNTSAPRFFFAFN